jgi:hypothetical protein
MKTYIISMITRNPVLPGVIYHHPVNYASITYLSHRNQGLGSKNATKWPGTLGTIWNVEFRTEAEEKKYKPANLIHNNFDWGYTDK